MLDGVTTEDAMLDDAMLDDAMLDDAMLDDAILDDATLEPKDGGTLIGDIGGTGHYILSYRNMKLVKQIARINLIDNTI